MKLELIAHTFTRPSIKLVSGGNSLISKLHIIVIESQYFVVKNINLFYCIIF